MVEIEYVMETLAYKIRMMALESKHIYRLVPPSVVSKLPQNALIALIRYAVHNISIYVFYERL